MKFVIQIADKRILINSIYSNAYRFCKEYLIDWDGKPDIEIEINDSVISAEMEREMHEYQVISLQSLETLAVYKLIAENMLRFDTLLMHGAVVAENNVSYMFTAPSGTGKTTHIRKWLENVDNSFVVNGDKPLVIVNKDSAFACGTPWCGKEHLSSNTIVPLKAIVLMEQAEENHIERISFAKAFPFLYQQVYQPDNEEKARKNLRLLSRMGSLVSFWYFQCNNFKDDCFQVAYNALAKDQA